MTFSLAAIVYDGHRVNKCLNRILNSDMRLHGKGVSWKDDGLDDDDDTMADDGDGGDEDEDDMGTDAAATTSSHARARALSSILAVMFSVSVTAAAERIARGEMFASPHPCINGAFLIALADGPHLVSFYELILYH